MRWNLFSKKLQKLLSRTKSNRRKRSQPLLYLEQLEKRWVMAVNLQLYNLQPATQDQAFTNRLLGEMTGTTGHTGDYTATIYWGDGYHTSASLVSMGDCNNTIQILGSYDYAYTGSDTVTINVTGPSSLDITQKTGILVVDAALSATFQPPSGVTITEGRNFNNLEVATFADPDPHFISNTAAYSASIDWGNGIQTLATTIVYDSVHDDFKVFGSELYEASGTYGVTVTIRSPEGSIATTSGSITAQPWLLQADGLSDLPQQSDSSDYAAEFSFNPYDPGPFVVNINSWGDGTSTPNAPTATYTFEQSDGMGGTYLYGGGYVVIGHDYPPGWSLRFVNFTVYDLHTGDVSTGFSGTGGFPGTAPDNPPWPAFAVADDSVHLTPNRLSLTEGETFAGNVATFTAPTPTDPNYADISWGDGYTDTFVPVSYSAGEYDVVGTHIYDRAGDYRVNVTVYQARLLDTIVGGGGAYSVDADTAWYTSGSALVADGAFVGTPSNFTATAGSDINDELLGAVTDDGTSESVYSYVAYIDWGDGSPISVATYADGYLGFSGSTYYIYGPHHEYANPGIYKTSILFRQADGYPADIPAVDSYWWVNPDDTVPPVVSESYSLLHGTATVNTTPLSGGTLSLVQAVPISGTEGTALSGVELATFHDTNLSDSYTVTIHWGDGSVATGSVTYLGSNNFEVVGTHTYENWGDYGFEVDIAGGGTSLSVYSTAVIATAETTLTIPVRNVDLSAPIYQREVGYFTTANTSLTADDFFARVDWGDGTWSVAQVLGSQGSFYVVAPTPTDVDSPFLLGGDIPIGRYNGVYDVSMTMQVTVYEWSNERSDGSMLPLLVAQDSQIVNALDAGVGSISRPRVFGWTATSSIEFPQNFLLGASIYWGDHTLPTGAHDGAETLGVRDHLFTTPNYSDVVANVEETPTRYTTLDGTIDVAPDLPGIIATSPVVLGNIGQPLEAVDSNNNFDSGVQFVTFLDQDEAAKLNHFKPLIDWGDGTPDSPGVITYSHGVFVITGYHTYWEAGSFTVLIKIYSSSEGVPDTVGATTAIITASTVLFQRESGTLLDVGASPSQDGGQVTVAPNTGTLQVYQPLDPRLSHDASTDGFIDVNGNPLQGQTSGDGRLLNMPTGATSGPNTFDALVYSSDRVDPRPIAEAYAAFNPANGVPTQIDVTLTFNGGTPQTTVDFSVNSADKPGATYLVGDQVASAVSASGAYPWTMTAEAIYSGGGNQTLTFSGTALVDNEDSSPFGPGWTLDGLNHLVVQSNGVLMLFGSGATPEWFPKDCSGNFPAFDQFFGTLAAVSGGYTYTSKYGIVWHFDSSGDMTSITDPHSLAATFTYSSGAPTTMAWPDGGVTTFSYSGSFITSIQEPGSRTLSLSQGTNLTGITDVDGTSRSFGYDSHHHLTSLNWAPLQATYTYDSTSGVLTGINDGLGTTYTLRPSNVVVLQSRGSAVSPQAAVAQWTDALSHRSIYTLDVPGWVTELDTPDGYSQLWFRDTFDKVVVYFDQDVHFTQYTYDNSSVGKGDQIAVSYAGVSSAEFGYENTFHRMTSSTDGNGNSALYSYNANTDLTRIQDPTGAVATFAWSSTGLETSATDPDGNTTTYQYQSAPSRLLTDSIDPLLARTTYAYDSRGFETGVQDARGYWTTTTFDARGRPLLQHNPDGGLITMGYDAIGDMTGYADASPMQHPILYSYDQRGLLTEVVDNWGGTSRLAYDAVENLTSTADQLNHTTTYAYDVVNRQTNVRDPMNALSTTAYDPAGNVIATIDADNHATSYNYDPLNEEISVEDANNNYTTTAYDAVGNVLSVENPDLETTYYAYDKDNRLTLETDATSHSMGTGYDPAGNVTVSIDDLGFRTTYSYDQDERQTRVLDPMGDVNTTMYDADGNVIETINPDLDQLTYTYDPMDRERTAEDPDLGVTTTTYDLAGNVLSVEDPRTGITTYTTDPVYHLSVIENALTGLATTYYDITGKAVSATDANGNIAFGSYLDLDGRVTASFDPGWQGTSYYYDPQGNITTVIDIHGKTTTYAYDRLNRPTLTTHPLGDTEQTVYDAVGNVIATKDGLNLTTSYAYDKDNRQTLVTHPLGDTEATQFDADDRIISQTDGDGNTTTYMYDKDGNQTTLEDALGHLTTTAYDKAGNATLVTDALNHSTQYLYDSSGRQTVTIDARGARTTTTYDLNGNVSTVTDPLGHVTSSSYDALNRSTSQTDGAGHTTRTLFDPTSRETGSVDGRGFTWSTAYSSALFYPFFGTSQTDPLGNTIGNAYYSDGEHVEYGDPLERVPGATANGYYDADRRLTAWVDELDRVTYTQYDMASRMTAQQMDDLWATYTYDNDGRVLTEQGSLVAGASYSYDPVGNVTAEMNAQGEVTTYLYDALNRVIVEQQPLSETVTTSYDAVGNILSVEDGDSNLTTYAYNEVNEKTSSTDPNGHVTLWAYDLAGQVTSTTDADSRTIKTSYDGDGQITSETWLAADGTTIQDTLTYQYDADENLTLASNNSGTYTMSYDADDRLTFEQEPFGASVTYAYDGMGDITMQQDSFGGLTSMTYNSDRELGNIQFSQGGSVPEQLSGFIDYNVDGTYTLIGRFKDSAETEETNTEGFGYNAAGQRSGDASYNLVPGWVQVSGNTYGYNNGGSADDGQGQLTSLAIYGGSTTTYSYDAAGQLTSSHNSTYGNLTYSYDAAGNSAAAGTTIGPDNQITTDGVWNYYYDAVGDRIKKINVADSDAWTFAYDDANRLITVKHYSSSSGGVPTGSPILEEDFTYDVFGNRLSDTLTQSGSTTVTRFAYDQNGNAWADLNSSNQLVTRRLYLQGVDELFARIDAATGQAYFYITDPNNTVEAIVDAVTGYAVNALTYDAYGNILNQTNPTFIDRYGYDGREFDSATDLYYNRARFYDPVTRTFISPDPAQADPLGNTYRFVGNDPMDGTDPSGNDVVDGTARLKAQVDPILKKQSNGQVLSSSEKELLKNWNNHQVWLRDNGLDSSGRPFIRGEAARITAQMQMEAVSGNLGASLRPSPVEQFGYVFDRLMGNEEFKSLLGEELVRRLDELRQPKNLAILLTSVGVGAGIATMGGPITAGIATGIGIILFGWEAKTIGSDLLDGIKTTLSVTSKNDHRIDEAANSFAVGLSTLAIDAGLAVVGHGAGKLIKKLPAIQKQVEYWKNRRAVSGVEVPETTRVGCFPAGTSVLMADYTTKPIESILQGELVLAYDLEKNKQVAESVLRVYFTSNRKFVRVLTDKGSLESTQHHMYWIAAACLWVRAIDLAPGDLLSLADGSTLAVTGIEIDERSIELPTFNLEVERCHNFYAGNREILVHNGPGANDPGYWNYHLVDAGGTTYYHGMAGPNETLVDVKYRHSNNGNRFDRGSGDKLVPEPGTRTYAEARRMEHSGILRDSTLLEDRAGENAGNYRGNRQRGISERNLENYYPDC